VGDIPCDIITGVGRTAECLANSSMFGNYQDDFLISLVRENDEKGDKFKIFYFLVTHLQSFSSIILTSSDNSCLANYLPVLMPTSSG
jgi:hypothetical protein